MAQQQHAISAGPGPGEGRVVLGAWEANRRAWKLEDVVAALRRQNVELLARLGISGERQAMLERHGLSEEG